MSEKFYDVGKIVNTQGLKGEVRVIASTDFIEERFQPGKRLYLFLEGSTEPLQVVIKTHRPHKQFQLLTLEGYHSISEAEKLKGSMLKITADERQDLPEDEFYFDQIIGLEVWSDAGDKVGSIKEIIQPGANDVWVVKRESQSDLLLPYIESCILKVDIENKKVIVHLLEGLE